MRNMKNQIKTIEVLRKISDKTIIPVISQEESFEEMVSFPDKDATEEEITEYLKK